jgi:hypothetical protein
MRPEAPPLAPYDHWAIWRSFDSSMTWRLVRVNALGYTDQREMRQMYVVYPPTRFATFYADRVEAVRRMAARALSEP